MEQQRAMQEAGEGAKGETEQKYYGNSVIDVNNTRIATANKFMRHLKNRTVIDSPCALRFVRSCTRDVRQKALPAEA